MQPKSTTFAHPLPAWACDCHVHVFGPFDRFPLSPERAYTPGTAPVEDLMYLMTQLGLHRVVVVQASPQGADNRCLVDALEHINSTSTLQARGVAVIHEATSDAELEQMHQAGVRGVRVNLESAGQDDPDVARQLLLWSAQRVAPWGWHVQTYTTLDVIASVSDCLLRLPVPVVIDHFGRPMASKGVDQPGFKTLLKLVSSGKIWVKLSAAHRISDLPDCEDAQHIAQALLNAHPDRMLWGTDWPHPGAWPGQARSPQMLEPFHPIDDARALQRISEWVGVLNWNKILQSNPEYLYQFNPT